MSMVSANFVLALIIVIILLVVIPDLKESATPSAVMYSVLLVSVALMLTANGLSLYCLSGGNSLRLHVATGAYYVFYYAVLAVFTWCLVIKTAEYAESRSGRSLQQAFAEVAARADKGIGARMRLHMMNIPNRTAGYAVTLICLLSAMLWLFAIPDEWFVAIEDGTFQRGVLYGAGQIGGVAVFIIDLILILRHRKALGKQGTRVHLTYVLVPVIAGVYRYLFHGDSILCIAWGVSSILIFITTQVNYSRRLREQELLLAQERAAIVMTQIQPHFLYNTLNTIYHLCGSAPKKAQTATGLFSDYLRENLESINRRTPVPFSMELKHIKTYLELEQMRFEERLRVVYDIRADAFLLPPLTVQPIVENAVRHGIGKRVEGGTVTIASNETDDTFEVTVTDDGVGLETLRKRIPASEKGGAEKAGSEPDRAGKKRTGAEREEQHTGIGIENVRIRLKEISDGTLMLEEGPGGQGVTVRISIPKQGNRV